MKKKAAKGYRAQYQARRNLRIQKRRQRQKVREKNGPFKQRSSRALKNKLRARWNSTQRTFFDRFFSPRAYRGEPKTVSIENELGLEADIENFFAVGKAILESEPRVLNFDLLNTTRIWGSGVVLLCSIKHWFDNTRSLGSPFPQIRSTLSNEKSVNDYLDFCGFHKYVNRVETTDEKRNLYRNITQRVVKIRRERSVSTSTKRERSGQILELLREFTHYDAEEIEVFKDRVLPEVLNNVMEHGVNNLDKGWYSLAQYHPNTGIISLCLADNGVGISNSLLNGPLGLDLRVRHPIKSGNDGDMIQIALKERISGAWTARRKGLALLGNNPKGEARGNGLTRIVKTCRELDIKFTLVSNRGAILIDGTKENVYNSDIKLFAGTLYHFVIPAKKIER